LLSADCVQVRIVGPGEEAVPLWLGAEDFPWLRALIDDFVRLDGRPYCEVMSFLGESPRNAAPTRKRRMATRTFLDLCSRERSPVDCAALRDAVFLAAQRARDAGHFVRSEVLADAARRLAVNNSEAEQLLFADLPGERRLALPIPLPDPSGLMSRINLELAQGLLRLASEVTIDLHGGARSVLRQVHLQRLLCTVRRLEADRVRLEISGPFSLFRHTSLYGRALASILPPLFRCQRFELLARCVVRGRSLAVRLQPGDPVIAGETRKPYDSRLEERFARQFARASLDWDLVREPEPVPAGNTLVFPDFAVVHRRDPTRSFLLEIVGFWTPDYLRDKLERLRSIPRVPLLLCIDRGLNCCAGELPQHAQVVWFQRRIDPASVLAAIESSAWTAGTQTTRIEFGDLFIDWAGLQPDSSPVHDRLAKLGLGDEVCIGRRGESLAIEAGGGPVAVFSRAGRTRWATRLGSVLSAKVVQIIERCSSDSTPHWRGNLRRLGWRVPIVEVVLEAPAGRQPAGSAIVDD